MTECIAPNDLVSKISPGESCLVASVVDGDTLTCEDGTRVRLLLIDAPEMDQGLFGETAKSHLEKLAPKGTQLSMQFDVDREDRYGRTLAHLVLADGTVINEEMLRLGLAVVSVYPPNVMHVDRYRALTEEAKANKRGLWALDAFDCSPSDHRAGACK